MSKEKLTINQKETLTKSKLESLVLRGRKIRENSIYREIPDLINQRREIFRDPDGILRVSIKGPSSEEAIDSLATTVRPFTMDGPTNLPFLEQVNGIKYLLKKKGIFTESLDNELKEISKAWKPYGTGEKKRKSFDVRSGLTLEDLGWAWFYYNNYHTDQEWRVIGRNTSHNTVFLNAVTLVCRIAVLVIALLEIIEEYRAFLDLDERCFTEDVVYNEAKSISELTVTNFFIGPARGPDYHFDPSKSTEELQAEGFKDFSESIGPKANNPESIVYNYTIFAIVGIHKDFVLTPAQIADIPHWLDFTLTKNSFRLHSSINQNWPSFNEGVKYLVVLSHLIKHPIMVHVLEDEQMKTVVVVPDEHDSNRAILRRFTGS